SPAARRGRRAGRPTRSGRAPYPTRFGSGPSSDAGSAARGAVGAGDSSGTAGAAPDVGAVPPGAGAAAPSSTSNVTSGSPTLTVWPSSACSDATTPAYGEGRSTSALAVSTSVITWLSSTPSPACTCQLTMTDSVRPSPRSGRRHSRSPVIGPPT